MKYNKGDKVRIRKWADMEKEYGLDEDGDIRISLFFTRKMKQYCGKVMTISYVTPFNSYMIEGAGGWFFTDEMLEDVADDFKIVITTYGVETLARLYKGGNVVGSATAKCSPDDTFDFLAGAKIAFERLVEERKSDDKPKYYNGKVVCIKTRYPWWTVGKVYEVVDGRITANNGVVYPKDGYEPYTDAEDVRHAGHATGKHNYENEFIPLVE